MQLFMIKVAGLCGVLLVSAFVFSGGAEAGDQNTELMPGALLSVRASGLAGKLSLLLNGKEELSLDGEGVFKFTSEIKKGDPFHVTIKELPVNHRCQLQGAKGAISADLPAVVQVVCRQTGQWYGPGALGDAVSTPGGQVSEAAVDIDRRGNGLIAWSQRVDGFDRIFKSECRDGICKPSVSMTEALSPPGGMAKKPKVAMADNGDAVIVWEQLFEDGRRVLMAERRGGEWRLPKSAADAISIGGKFAWEAEVAINGAGDTVVVWDQASASGVHAIYKSEYRNGKWRHPQGFDDCISLREGGDALLPKVAINTKGEIVLVWEQEIDGFTRIFKSEYRKGKWRHPSGANDFISPKGEGAREAGMPLVAMNDAGETIVAWKQGYRNSDGVFLSEFRNGRWRHPKSVDEAITPSGLNVMINDLAMDGKGNALLLWSGYRERRQTLHRSEYRQGKWHHPKENEAMVSPPKTAWEFWVSGKAAMADDGKAVVAWTQQGDGVVPSAYLAEYDNDRWYLPGKLLNIMEQPASDVALAASPNGNVIVVWSQSDGINSRLYGKVFRSTEEFVPAKPPLEKKGDKLKR